MKRRKHVDAIRVLASLFVFVTISFFYINLFSPSHMPKLFRIGVLRKPLTVLLLGSDISFDYMTGKPSPNLEGRTDTIMLAYINPINNSISLFSIPRDTYANIPGYGVQKINAANVFGGPQLICKTISELVNKEINYYIEIKPTAIPKMVDAVGGVYLEVEKDMRYVDRAQGLDINLKQGWQKLSGKKAHEYIRFRHDAFGDIGRISRQQKFLQALRQSFTKPANLARAPFAFMTIFDQIETNLPVPTTVKLVNFARTLPLKNVKTYMVSGEATTINAPGGGSVWLPDKASIIKDMEMIY